MTRTTLPVLPPNPPTLQTARLLLRPFHPTDLVHYYLLRRQPEVMKWTSKLRCDETVSQTKEWMAGFLPSEEVKTFSFSIEELHNPGQVIGSVGFDVFPGKRPEIGYMFRKEVWGKGYATEGVQTVLEAYWSLERRELELDAHFVEGGDGGEREHDHEDRASQEDRDRAGFQAEELLAVTDPTNIGSRRVLEKFGFVMVREFGSGERESVEYVLRRPGG